MTDGLRLCVISDIHGNVDALRAVLERIRARGADLVVVAGDLAAQGPRPAEAVDELRGLPGALLIRGNTDRYLTQAELVPPPYWRADEMPERLASLAWTRDQLGTERLEFLAALPEATTVAGCLVVHGSPGDDERGIFPHTPLERFDTAAWTSVMTCGHTHHPVHRVFDGRHLVNAGSVGWPLDGDARPSFALIEWGDPANGPAIALERAGYDGHAVVADLEARKVPWRAQVARRIESARTPMPAGSDA